MTEQEMFTALVKKENNFLLFEKDAQKIYILGTIHDFHFDETNNYSLAHVQSVIKTIQPEALLIEGRHETLKKHNAVDGPFEMLFARCCADELNIPVKGVDYWSVVKTKEAYDALDKERDDKIFENILTAARRYKCVLVMLGASHRERMPVRFESNGYKKFEVENVLRYFENVEEPFIYPKGMEREYKRSIEYYQTAFLDEVTLNLTQDDELHGMFTELSSPSQQRELLCTLIKENELYMTA